MNRRMAGFALALIAQVALLAAVPWDRGSDASTAQTIWLKATTAGDHHDVMRGQYLNLTYDISEPRQFTEVAELPTGVPVYAVVHETRPGIWSALRVERELPADLPPGQVAIKGQTVDRGLQIQAFLREKADGSWTADSVVTRNQHSPFDREQKDRALASAWVPRQGIAYPDIESYFVPQSQRRRVEEDLRAHPDAIRVQVRVSDTGRAALLQMRIEDRPYDF